MSRALVFLSSVVFFGAFGEIRPARAAAEEVPKVHWFCDYSEARTLAERENRMLLIFFHRAGKDEECRQFKTQTLDDPRVRRKLQEYVCAEISLEAKIDFQQRAIRLIDHAAFAEMHGRPGIAIIDLCSQDPQLYARVVSSFPLTAKLWYTPERMAVILDLPPGTLTQRTLIYAVRTHPDRPESTDGKVDSYLLAEAQSHSQYQARICVQGHHRWGARFPRIAARLRGGAPCEVCAQSWPGENLVEAAVECVRCWRLSDGHWRAVRAYHRRFGYDMQRGCNGVWYATGILAGRRDGGRRDG
jgi:hypothetical protein